MSKKVKKLLLFLFTIFLIIIFTPIFGGLYDKYFGPVTTWFWGSTHPEYFEGFFISYMFFVSLLITIFGGKNKYKNLIILLGILFLFDFILGAWEGLIVDVIIALMGWLLAQGSLLIYKKFKKT